MAAISSRAAGGVENKYKFNAGTELSEELYIQYYETPIRNYDPQIGRFTGIDVLAEYTYGINPYQFCINNPVMFIDPDGMRPWAPSESGQDGGAQIDYSSYSSGNGRYDWSRAETWEADNALIGWAEDLAIWIGGSGSESNYNYGTYYFTSEGRFITSTNGGDYNRLFIISINNVGNFNSLKDDFFLSIKSDGGKLFDQMILTGKLVSVIMVCWWENTNG